MVVAEKHPNRVSNHTDRLFGLVAFYLLTRKKAGSGVPSLAGSSCERSTNSSLHNMASTSLHRIGGNVVLMVIAFLEAVLEGSSCCRRDANGVRGLT